MAARQGRIHKSGTLALCPRFLTVFTEEKNTRTPLELGKGNTVVVRLQVYNSGSVRWVQVNYMEEKQNIAMLARDAQFKCYIHFHDPTSFQIKSPDLISRPHNPFSCLPLHQIFWDNVRVCVHLQSQVKNVQISPSRSIVLYFLQAACIHIVL